MKSKNQRTVIKIYYGTMITIKADPQYVIEACQYCKTRSSAGANICYGECDKDSPIFRQVMEELNKLQEE